MFVQDQARGDDESRKRTPSPIPSALARRGLNGTPAFPRVAERKGRGSFPIYQGNAWTDFPYIQFAPSNSRNAIFVDIDDEGKAFDARLAFENPPKKDPREARFEEHPADVIAHFCRPSYWSWNERTEHMQAAWFLGTPVHFNRNSSIKAMRFYNVVSSYLGEQLGSDPGCSGYLLQNPAYTHNRAEGKVVTLGPERLHGYELSDFTAFLPKDYKPSHARLLQYGLGRNCDLFFSLCRLFGCRKNWERSVQEEAERLNSLFENPLGMPEVLGIARSVVKYLARWKLKDRGLDLKARSLYARDNARKRWAKTESKRLARREQAILRLEAGESVRAIAADLGCSKSYVSNVRRDLSLDPYKEKGRGEATGRLPV